MGPSVPSLPVGEETLERLRSGKAVLLVAPEELGLTTLILHRFGILGTPEALMGMFFVELDPWKVVRGVKQQPLNEMPEHWEQRERVHQVREAATAAVERGELDAAAKLINLWGEELHKLRSHEDPAVVRDALTAARSEAGIE